MTLYVDGNQVGTKVRDNVLSDADVNTKGISIGDDVEYTGRTWPGEIDSFRIMDVCLSADQVKEEMVATSHTNVVVGLDFADSEFKEVTVGEYQDFSYYGYGGDWDDAARNDGSFCGNGILNADRSESAKLADVKKVHQEINFYNEDLLNGKVKVVNEHTSIDLDEFAITYQVYKNDKVIKEGTLDLSTKAGEEEVVTLDLPEFKSVRENDDYFVSFTAKLKEARNWASAGHVVAEEQLVLDLDTNEKAPVIDSSEMESFKEVKDTNNSLTVKGEEFELTIDKTTGYMTSYKYNDELLMSEGPVPNYFRTPIENDRVGGLGYDPKLFNTADNYAVTSVDVDKSDKLITVTVNGNITTSTPSPDTITYMIFSNGEIIVNNTATINSSKALTRVGMKISVPEEFENFTYYGRGPWENYIDRNTGTFISTYETTVDEIEAENKYLRPQENGNRTDVRYAAVRNENGVGFMVQADDVMETSLSKYEDEAMTDKRHMYEVEENDGYLVFNIDEIQRGLGGAACGPAPLSQYLLANNTTYSQTFRIVPFTSATNDELMEESKVDMDSLNPIKNITVNGQNIGFDPVTSTYNVKLLKGTFVGMPKVEVEKMAADVVVDEFKQPTTLPATVTVKGTSPFGKEATYTIHIEEVDELYLSDMTWTKDVKGYFNNWRDKSGDNGEHTIAVYVGGQIKTFAKGVGAHANSTIEVDLTGKNFTKFTAYAGINANQQNAGDVIFRVYVDGVLAGESRQQGRGNAKFFEIDVTNAKKVTLEVDSNGADSYDHGTWADAKFFNDNPVVEADKVALTALVAEADKVTADKYTEESYAAFNEVLTKAKLALTTD